MSKLEDLTGLRFGRLFVVNRADSKNGKTYWNCLCDCGNETITYSVNLTKGKSLSCGCYNKEQTSKAKLKHGKRESKLYKIWANMKQRCYNINNKKYKNYGGRGIVVCDEWKFDFELFYTWSIENGYKEDTFLSLDRIDVNGNYQPNNCRWTTQKVQQNNKRNNLYITINGDTKTAREWEESNGLTYGTIARRISLGWEEMDLLNKPNKQKNQSGIKGISWSKHDETWRVRMKIDGKVKSFGSYKKIEDAIKRKEEIMNSETKVK